MELLGKVALVTGASAGIGAAICKDLVKNGLKVIGCARNTDPIRTLSEKLSNESGQLFDYKCDLVHENEVDEMFKWIKSNEELKKVDICINNAGFSNPTPLLKGNVDIWRQMLDLNVVALCNVTQKSIHSMRDSGVKNGHIIMMNSISGHVIPGNASSHFYSATKFCVTSLTECWRKEVQDMDIRVTAISPGLVKTEFAYRKHKDEPGVAEKIYAENKCLNAEDISSSVLHVLKAPKHVQIQDVLMRAN